MMNSFRQDWLSNVRNDMLAGAVVALALIPEAIAFSIIAGVDPKIGLYASFSIATIIALTGGRPGMISAATGAMALVMVMLATVLVTVGTHDLAKGVLVGVLLSGFFFANKIGQILHISSETEDKGLNEGRMRSYSVTGQVFFESAERFINAFDFKEAIYKVRIDVSRAHFWDITAINALDKVVIKFRRESIKVEVIGLNQASATMVDKFATHDKDGADDILMGH